MNATADPLLADLWQPCPYHTWCNHSWVCCKQHLLSVMLLHDIKTAAWSTQHTAAGSTAWQQECMLPLLQPVLGSKSMHCQMPRGMQIARLSLKGFLNYKLPRVLLNMAWMYRPIYFAKWLNDLEQMHKLKVATRPKLLSTAWKNQLSCHAALQLMQQQWSLSVTYLGFYGKIAESWYIACATVLNQVATNKNNSPIWDFWGRTDTSLRGTHHCKDCTQCISTAPQSKSSSAI